jgi:hypothetical protein
VTIARLAAPAAALALAVGTPAAHAADSDDAVLVTAEQLAKLAAAVEGGPVAPGVERVRTVRSRGPANDGPVVELVTPAAGAIVTAPLALELRFSPRSAPVDPASVQVWYVLRKGELEFEMDVTQQARKHFTASGARLWIPDGAPRGEHRVRLAIRDEEGKRTEERFSLVLQ